MARAQVRCLVTGSTGYIGSRLIPQLIARGHTVRAMARKPDKLAAVPWRSDVEVTRADLTDPDSLHQAFAGVDVVYYLAHAMGTSADFVADEKRAATNVVEAARKAGVKRLVYLSGLHPAGAQLSRHLQSRTAVGDILIDSGIETIVLQAGVVIGSGSASFEMIRHLTDRLPLMTTPKWVHNKIQPIAVADVLHYLVAAATARVLSSRTWDIGGPDVLEYGEMMQIYADVAGLRKRRILVLPFLTPTIASWWVGLVTPIPSGLARPLVESLHCDAVADEHDIDAVIAPPDGGLTPYRASVELALDPVADGEFEPTWSTDTPAAALPSDPLWSGQIVYRHTVSALSPASPAATWESVQQLGNGRWEVAGRDARTSLVLCDRNVPGDAWLTLQVSADGNGSRYEQQSSFRPRGVTGRLYGVTVWPVRRILLRHRAAKLLDA